MPPCSDIWRRDIVEHDCATWPEEDRQRWLELFADDDPLKPRPWVRATAFQNAGVYTRYLACVRRHGLEDRLSYAGVCAFIREREAAGNVMRTIAGYVASLYKIGRLLRPEEDLGWLLKSLRNTLKVAEQSVKLRNGRLADALEIYRLGQDLVAKARRLGPASWNATELYRTGLFLCFGLIVQERLRAQTGLTLDDIDLDDAHVFYAAHLIKNKHESERVFNDEVRAMLREWVDVFRARWRPQHRALWIARGGQPATAATLAAAMRRVTRRALGVALSPHSLRHAAATFLARMAPEHAPLATTILGQRSEAVTREYTETADNLQASRDAAALIEGHGKEIRRLVRANTRSEIALSPRRRRRAMRRGRRAKKKFRPRQPKSRAKDNIREK